MQKRHSAWRYTTALIVVSSLAAAAQAQNFERVAPQPVPTQPAPTAPGTAAMPQAIAREPGVLVVPQLRGLAFVPDRDAVKPEGVTVTGISAAGLDPLADPDFMRIVSSYIGKPLTFGDLHAITQAVVTTYAAHGRPLVRAIVPEQNVDGGAIQVIVMEYKIGTVTVTGNRWFSDEQVAAPFRFHRGDTVTTEQISAALDTANANPFRRVELVYRPSVDVGYTDLVLQTQDRLPFRPYAGYDNSGPRATGRDRWNLGFNWGRAFGLDQQLSYQLTTSSDFWSGRRHPNGRKKASFVAHSLIWSAPLSWGDRITVFGAYERSYPNIGVDFDLVGKAGQASIRYQHRLPQWLGMTQDIQAGFDFKSTNNNLDFGGLRVSRSQTEIAQFLGIYSTTRPDRLGATSLVATLVYSPGGLTGANRDADFQPSLTKPGRLGAKANYFYSRGEIGRQTLLPLNAIWSLRLTGQISNRPLLETEQVSVGGIDLLRGYDPNAINGDQGIVVSNEIRTPNLVKVANSRLALLGFWDYASLTNKRPLPDQARHVRASSAGVGLRFNVAARVVVKADYGWQLKTLPRQVSKGNRGMVSMTVAY